MIPAKRLATSRHLLSNLSRTLCHYTRPASSISIVRTAGKRPTLLNIERITGHESIWRVHQRGYALETTSKRILCIALYFEILDVIRYNASSAF
jgi:hypothetical protein